MKAEHFLIKAIFARAHNLPVSFVAIRAKESKKAVWVYGHGAMDPHGHCARCGRTLTHPGSILIGIGPECLGDWGARDFKLENMSEEEQQRLKALVTDRPVDQWIPLSIIKQATPSNEDIELPENHKSLSPKLPTLPDEVPTVTVLPDYTQTLTGTPVTQVGQPKVEMTTKKAREWKGGIAVAFPFSTDILQKVKTLEGRKYHPEGKYWTCDLLLESVQKLKQWEFALDDKLSAMLTTTAPSTNNNMPSKEEVLDALAESCWLALKKSGIKRDLFEYQKTGVAFMDYRKGRALLADEMGLGKTIQVLAYLQLRADLRPAVVVCPASLKLNWAKEIRDTMTRNCSVAILEGKKPYRTHADILIINYDILPHWIKMLEGRPKIVISDEVHYIKSSGTKKKPVKRTHAVRALAKGCHHFIGVSGTPIVNRPIEIYNALKIISPSTAPPFWDYVHKFCDAKNNGFGWDFNGASNTEELHKLLTSTVMIRRKKKDVLKDLPDKIRSIVPMTLDNQAEYDSIEDDVIAYIKKKRGEKAAKKAANAEVLVQMEHLKQAAVKGKLNAVIEWIQDFLETDEKLVVFATHKFVIDKLMEVFGKVAVKVDGSMTMTEKNTSVEQFQTNPRVKLFVGNSKAAGVGLTLTAASNVAVVELPWTPGDLQQVEDRCHRIGAKDTVNVYFPLVEGTIEEKIAKLLDKKMKVLDSVHDGAQTSPESLLTELMDMLEGEGRKKDNKKLQGVAINDALKMLNR